MDNIKKQLIVKFVELNQLVDLFGMRNTAVGAKKLEIISLLKDLEFLTGNTNLETMNKINSIVDFDKEACKKLIDKNLKLLFWDKELK